MGYFLNEFSDVKVSKISDRLAMKHHIYEFVLDKCDYFPLLRLVWNQCETVVYKFKVGDVEISIPSGMYIMISDESGLVDWTLIDEIIGRDIDVLVLGKDFVGWKLRTMILLTCEEEEYFWPNTKNVVPISDSSGNTIVLTSRSDQYKNTVNKIAQDFVVG